MMLIEKGVESGKWRRTSKDKKNKNVIFVLFQCSNLILSVCPIDYLKFKVFFVCISHKLIWNEMRWSFVELHQIWNWYRFALISLFLVCRTKFPRNDFESLHCDFKLSLMSFLKSFYILFKMKCIHTLFFFFFWVMVWLMAHADAHHSIYQINIMQIPNAYGICVTRSISNYN